MESTRQSKQNWKTIIINHLNFKIMANSKFNRRFDYQISESGATETIKDLTVERITKGDKEMGADYEFIYALEFYGFDKILDMKFGESLFIQPNRDNAESKGILTRTI